VVDEAVWLRQEEKAQSRAPGLIEIFNEQKVSVYFSSFPFLIIEVSICLNDFESARW